MNLDNFVVRPQRRSVEKFAKLESWNKLGTDSFTELAKKVSNLPTALLDNDEDAKRFDMLVLRTQLAILQARPDFAALRERVQAIARALEEQDAIPTIKAHMVLIQAIAGDEWWEGVTLAKFKDKARQFLKAHESHLSLQRLRRNQPLTPSDLVELGKMPVQAGGSVEVIQ